MKKLTSFVLATVATLLLVGSTFAHGHIGVTFFGGGYNHVVGYNAFPVRTFSFAPAVYARSDAYFTYTPFTLVAQPPVVTLAAPAPCLPQVAEPQPAVTYAAPAPAVTYAAPAQVDYAAPVATCGLLGINPGYAIGAGYNVGAFGYPVGVNRFSFYGVNRFGVPFGVNRFGLPHGVNRFGVPVGGVGFDRVTTIHGPFGGVIQTREHRRR